MPRTITFEEAWARAQDAIQKMGEAKPTEPSSKSMLDASTDYEYWVEVHELGVSWQRIVKFLTAVLARGGLEAYAIVYHDSPEDTAEDLLDR